MKLSSQTSKSTLAGLLSVMLGLLSVSAAHAQFLLTINDSNPFAVVITATGTFPTSPATGADAGPFNNGVDLLQFFTATQTLNSSSYPIGPTSLTTGDSSSGPVLDYALNDNYSFGKTTSLSGVDLNLLTFSADSGSGNLMTFTSGSAAFSGTLTLNLYGTPLPSPGASGAIVTGANGFTPNTSIGQWEVVSAPEPSSWALMLVGLGAIAGLRRRRLRA